MWNKTVFIASTLLLLSSCAVYKIDIQQGNVVTQDMLDQLTIGMPANKVRFIMGSPLVRDTFHDNRWDYLYSFKSGNAVREQRLITLLFENELLVGVAGDITIGRFDERPPQRPIEVPEELPIL